MTIVSWHKDGKIKAEGGLEWEEDGDFDAQNGHVMLGYATTASALLKRAQELTQKVQQQIESFRSKVLEYLS